uniref:Uncharacterized protein n=1 Tax=Tanacetum cinerariifolium TaxID=118510 RepID=A0A699J5X1_TANCI|nr:hypothetical protein [Tanacetum cinerariifolium]
MDTTIDQQVAMDEALVPHAHRLRIGRSNFRLLSDIFSKESTLQLVYDVLRLTPFFKAFLVTADVPKIYMQEFWATITVHHHSIQFKMDNKKHIVNLESFREMLRICPRLPGQSFVEPPFEEVILSFLHFLGHSGAIRRLTNVEHKDTKKSNEMYYPRFTKVIIHHFMSKDPSIPRRNKVNWHYVRDDHMFTTIKLVSKHQNTQQFGAILPIELTNEDIRNSDAYKEYYAVSTGATPPKPKASVRKTRSSSDTTVTPLTATAGPRLSTSAKGKQPATTSKAKSLSALSEVAMTKQTHISQASGSGADEGTGIIPWVPNVPTEESDEEISWKSSYEEDDDDVDEGSDDQEEEDAQEDKDAQNDDDDQDDYNQDDDDQDERDDDDDQDEGQDKKDDEDELYKDVNINLEGRVVQMADVHTTQEFEDSHVTLTPAPTTVAPLPLVAPTLTPSTIATISTVPQAPTPSTTASSILLQDLPNFGSLFRFDHRLKTLNEKFSEFVQTNQFAGAVFSILGIIQRYMDQWINEAVKALVEAYESDKIILDTYGDTVMLKRRRDDDADKDEEPSTGSDPESKRRREGKEPELASALKEKATRSAGKSTQGSKS